MAESHPDAKDDVDAVCDSAEVAASRSRRQSHVPTHEDGGQRRQKERKRGAGGFGRLEIHPGQVPPSLIFRPSVSNAFSQTRARRILCRVFVILCAPLFHSRYVKKRDGLTIHRRLCWFSDSRIDAAAICPDDVVDCQFSK